MISKIEIRNLRGIREGVVDELSPFSILVGRNNSGKSTILEAFLIGRSNGDANVVADVALRRGWCGLGCVQQLFYDPGQKARIALTDEQAQRVTSLQLGTPDQDLDAEVRGNASFVERIQITAKSGEAHKSRILLASDGQRSNCFWTPSNPPGAPPPFLTAHGIAEFDTLEDAYSAAAGGGHEKHLDELFTRIEKGQKSTTLRILRADGRYVLHTIRGERSVAAYFEGDGYKRLLQTACVLAASPGKLVLMEEPEAFQHPGFLKEFATLAWGAIAQGTQIVMSTHSLELLTLLACEDNVPLDKLALFRTRLTSGTLGTSRIQGGRVRERLEEVGEDLRQ